MIKIDLKESQDGYFVSSYVQAEDEHKYRLQEIAEQLDGHIIG